MRLKFAALALPLLALPLLTLGACGGAGTGLNSIGSSAGSGGGTTSGTTTPTGTPTATPTPTATSTPTPTATATPTTTTPAAGSGGTGGASGTATQTPAATATTQANMFDVAATTVFGALGAAQSMVIDTKGTLYRGNASTADAPTGTISYNPRDGIFTVAIADAAAGVSRNVTFQDPAHRATSDTARSGEYQVPLLAGFNYLQALDGEAQFTFFYQRPTAAGAFVSLAGFDRTLIDASGSTEDRGVMVFGTRTAQLQLPTSGSARYDGSFLATMVEQSAPTGSDPILQWINGTSAIDVDFARRGVTVALNGIVGPAYIKANANIIPDAQLSIPSGAAFAAQATASWTASSTAFAGRFSSASFAANGTTRSVDFTAVSNATMAAGASSIDGSFYGPDAKNVGGNFRIVGGLPDQRVDILGGFVGAKK